MYTALYRTQRPEVFEEILGQEHIVKILTHQLETDSVSHAYLFCGTRGTGKTTTARILAKGVNCLSQGRKPCGACSHCASIKEGTFMDVVEIDAASNNGVENIRELRESVKYPPAVGKKKVYIIDEVHMLSTGAFNALLKTLEEPPEHVMFILATTEPQKLPPTILSRCMRLDFRRVSQSVIGENMKEICQERGVEITPDAVRLLANCADGSVRDGLSILDQVLAGGDSEIDREKVLEYVGTTGDEFFIELTELVSKGKTAESLLLLNEVLLEGKDVKQIMKDWVSHYRSLLITKFVKDAGDMLNMSRENLERVSEQSQNISLEEIDFAITRLSKTINDGRWSTNPRVLLELAIVSIAGGEGTNTAIPPAIFKRNETPERYTETKTEETVPRCKEAEEKKPVEKKRQAPKVEPVEIDYSNKRLWESLFEEGEGAIGSFNLIKNGTKLYKIEKDTFVVLANSSFTQKYVEQKVSQLEGLMEEKLGKYLKLICKLEENITGEEKKNETTEDLAREAGAILGLNIEIE